MSEIVARAARALVDAQGQWETENNRLGGQVPWQEQHAALLVRAVLLSIREPTEAMIMSAPKTHTTEIGRYGAVEFWPTLRGAGDVYTAMIDEARK